MCSYIIPTKFLTMADRLIIILFITFYLVHRTSAHLSCYVCATASYQYPNRTIKSCTYFEETKEFEISCPYSTYCMKRISELVVQNGQIIRVEERGCASQKYTYHRLENGRWVQENGIEQEIYHEGCFPEKQPDELKAAKSVYCYCSSNLCNTGKRSSETSFFHHTDAMSVIFIFNVVKFMRNVR